jgi:hypothetical protein
MHPTHAVSSPRPLLERGFLAALVLLVVLLSVRTLLRVADDRSAFRRWQPQLQQLQNGSDLSAEFNYPNPPMMAVLLEPFALLPPLAGALAWFYAKAAMAGLSLFWVIRLVDSDGRRFPGWAWMLVVVCGLKPILDDLAHGNVNLLVLFLVVAALTAYRRERDLLAGVVLALAIACKVTPALFVPYFLWKRSWRVLAGCAAGVLLFLWPGVVPGLRLGFAENLKQTDSWYRVMVRPYLVEGKVTSENLNQSLPGLVARMATHSPSFVGWEGNDEVPLRYDNFLDLSPAAAKLLVQGCMVAFGLLVIWCCVTPTAPRTGWRLPAEFALVTLGMLLFSERTWKHHAVTLVLPFAVVVYVMARGKLERRWHVGLGLVLAATLALMLVPGLGGGKDRFASGRSPELAKLAQVYGAYTWAFVLLAGAMVALLRKSPSVHSCRIS